MLMMLVSLGFVLVEANVKKWGLAPIQGTLAPPPAYGFESGSLLLERGSSRQQQGRILRHYRDADSDGDGDDDDDEQPLIQIYAPIPRSTSTPQRPPYSQRPTFPTHSPPSYSALPRPHFMTGYGSTSNTNTSSH